MVKVIINYFFCGRNITLTNDKYDKYYVGSSSITIGKKQFTEFRYARTRTSISERSKRPLQLK